MAQEFVRPRNADAYALGKLDAYGHFHVRRIVWGRLLAREEKRPDEKIKRARILVMR